MATEIIITDEFRDWFRGLTEAEQDSIERIVQMLEEAGVTLRFPYSSGIEGSKFPEMRELRIQHAGKPYRVLYAFDRVRNAVMLVGGVKTSLGKRWYVDAIRLADRLRDEYLRGV